jgi:hypothetical protein
MCRGAEEQIKWHGLSVFFECIMGSREGRDSQREFFVESGERGTMFSSEAV